MNIKLQIDAEVLDDEHCGKCDHLKHDETGDNPFSYCDVGGIVLDADTLSYFRTPECKTAEVLEKVCKWTTSRADVVDQIICDTQCGRILVSFNGEIYCPYCGGKVE